MAESRAECLEKLNDKYRDRLKENIEIARICRFSIFICLSSTIDKELLDKLNEQTEELYQAEKEDCPKE